MKTLDIADTVFELDQAYKGFPYCKDDFSLNHKVRVREVVQLMVFVSFVSSCKNRTFITACPVAETPKNPSNLHIIKPSFIANGLY